jgi:hypothetical protein
VAGLLAVMVPLLEIEPESSGLTYMPVVVELEVAVMEPLEVIVSDPAASAISCEETALFIVVAQTEDAWLGITATETAAPMTSFFHCDEYRFFIEHSLFFVLAYRHIMNGHSPLIRHVRIIKVKKIYPAP